MTLVAGVDVCKGGWVAVLREDEQPPRLETASSLADLLNHQPRLAAVAVDIPMKLLTGRSRKAEIAARALVGPRASSIFNTPPREALEAPTYEEATTISYEATGKGISKQSYALRDRALEADQVDDSRLFEFHPEVTFAAMNGGPLEWSKKSWNGCVTRYGLLQRAGFELLGKLLGGDLAGRASADDVLDAAAGAWTARRFLENRAQSLPCPPEKDHRGLDSAIWY